MSMAREFNRTDWRQMLAGMSCSEYEEWRGYWHEHFFTDALLDAHFAALNLNVVSLVCGDREGELTPAHFSLLSPQPLPEQLPEHEPDDEQMMALAESISGGVRYVPASG
ncbi:MAG: phage tail assembly protein T [Enterobacteriaceae bacterium]|nr:phage tail assembly protein T [Enterobacteriaceae bacterium]